MQCNRRTPGMMPITLLMLLRAACSPSYRQGQQQNKILHRRVRAIAHATGHIQMTTGSTGHLCGLWRLCSPPPSSILDPERPAQERSRRLSQASAKHQLRQTASATGAMTIPPRSLTGGVAAQCTCETTCRPLQPSRRIRRAKRRFVQTAQRH